MTTMRGVWIVGVLVLAVAMAGVASANQPPQAEAGLDQEAVVNGTVYLDAGGSLDPDGRIVDYAWSIETPGGNTTTPDCPSCVQTHFVPRENGTYAVTVTARDDEGVTMADTMYVYVAGSPVQNSSNGSEGGGSSEASVSVPSVGSGTGSSGSGSIHPDPNRIMRVDEDYVLRTGAGSNGGFTMMVGGREVTIPSWRMEIAAADDGQVEFSEVENYFKELGANEGDIQHEIQESRRSCGSYVCTAQVDRTSGERSEEMSNEKKLQEKLEEKMDCRFNCFPLDRNNDDDSDSDDSSDGTSSPSDSSNSGDSSDSGDGVNIGNVDVSSSGGGGSSSIGPGGAVTGGGFGNSGGLDIKAV